MRISDWSSDVCSSDLYRNRARRAEYLDAIQEMLARTNSHWAPWTVIDGNNQKAARIAALESIAEQLRSEEHTSELQSLMRISYAVFCLKKKKISTIQKETTILTTSMITQHKKSPI